jgi:anti-sigma regulatory factor (Ser/Thr protein kinase)
MSATAAARGALVEWCHAGRALAAPGEGPESGDMYAVVAVEAGTLLAVIDGLGHGTAAAAAARAAVAILEEHGAACVAAEGPGGGLLRLVERCHADLRELRGAVMSVAWLASAPAELTWLGVGNVEGVLLHADPRAEPRCEGLASRSGVVGFRLPTLRTRTHPLARGDTLIFASDGIHTTFSTGLPLALPPQELAELILARFGKDTDDALVLVARYLGGGVVISGAGPTPGEYAEAPSLRVPVRHEADVVVARQRVGALATELGLSEVAVDELVIAVSEIARNLVVHGGGGELLAGALHRWRRRGVFVIARDRGRGIADLELAMRDGYSTGGGGLGLGLPSARRLVDELELDSVVGEGTTVVLRKWGR